MRFGNTSKTANVILTTVNRLIRMLLNHCSNARPKATRTFLVCATVDYK